MHLFIFLFTVLLFFVLTPGILLSIPYKSSKNTVAITHAIVFALVWSFTHKIAWNWGVRNRWMTASKEAMTLRQCKNKGGRYDGGDCYDNDNKIMGTETKTTNPSVNENTTTETEEDTSE